MKDRNLLHILTLTGLAGLTFLFRKKGSVKDWFLIYFIKSLISTLIDGPIIKKKYVQYPLRYFPSLYSSNIIFLYVFFPLSCVMYNQFTYQMRPLKTIISVLLFSGPMAIVEGLLEKYTKLVKYQKGWNGWYSFGALTCTFWIVRSSIAGIRYLEASRKDSKG